MTKNRSGRLLFVFVVIVLLGIIGRNFYQRFVNNSLIVAIRQNDVTGARALLEHGADPASYQPKSRESMTDTPALAFVITGSFASPEQQKIACLLIQNGALAHVDAKTLNNYLLNACAGGGTRGCTRLTRRPGCGREYRGEGRGAWNHHAVYGCPEGQLERGALAAGSGRK